MIKKYSLSSNSWLKKHFNDKYVQQAHQKKLRSRAWFKLDQIQKSDKIFFPGINVVDLGSSPGGWSQYVVMQIGNKGSVIACDILPMNSIIGVDFIQGDFSNPLVLKLLIDIIGKKKVQVVLSDMAPNISGIPEVDIPKSRYLVKLALNLCLKVLTPNGSFVVKIFQGENFDNYLHTIRSIFNNVKIRKPEASRTSSREVYIVAKNRKL